MMNSLSSIIYREAIVIKSPISKEGVKAETNPEYNREYQRKWRRTHLGYYAKYRMKKVE